MSERKPRAARPAYVAPEPSPVEELEPALLEGGRKLTNAQVALLAASTHRLSIVSNDQDTREVLDRADHFKRWLDDHDGEEA